ncbi:MAG: DUF4375 domain-containing protein [Taibaiella sp.]|nr:DUF4375 domain-containing protein [Taibaiella sp.]
MQLRDLYDLLSPHLLQGGFIQLIQNGYVRLLLPLHEELTAANMNDMALLIDDALRQYVVDHDALDKPTTVQEFAQLYQQLPAFGPLHQRFIALHPATVERIVEHMG